jgi:hypothetical protein
MAVLKLFEIRLPNGERWLEAWPADYNREHVLFAAQSKHKKFRLREVEGGSWLVQAPRGQSDGVYTGWCINERGEQVNG